LINDKKLDKNCKFLLSFHIVFLWIIYYIVTIKEKRGNSFSMNFFIFESIAESLLIYTNSSSGALNIVLSATLIGAFCFLIFYVFEAIALYTIAKKNGYDRRWMAFVPILNTYYIGVVSDKNKVFNINGRIIGIVAAAAELVYFLLSTVELVSVFVLAAKGYIEIGYTTMVSVSGTTVAIPYGLELASSNVPTNLAWAAWVALYLSSYVTTWFSLIFSIADVALMVAFFQTYYAKHYVMFSICAFLFPIEGVLMFVVRNNRGKNYREYIREQQARQYAAYQEYNRRMAQNNPYNYNPYSGRTQPPPQGNPYESPRSTSAVDDPFSEFGSSNSDQQSQNNSYNNGDDNSDPFGDL
jgi:hypothetical protein